MLGETWDRGVLVVRFVVAIIGMVVAGMVAGCGGGGDEPAPPPSEVTGLVTEIERDNGDVRSFTLETEGGTTYEIEIDQGYDYGFDVDHLQEHLDQEEPVTVGIDRRGDRAVARSIED